MDGRSVSDAQKKIVNDNLVAAAFEDDREKIDLCLQKGADIDARGTWCNRTALMIAAAYAKPDLVAFLLERGPDLLLKDSDDKTVFDIAGDIRDGSTRKQINHMLLAGLPDPQSTAAPEQAAGDTAAPEEIPVLKPIAFDSRKKTGKSFQL